MAFKLMLINTISSSSRALPGLMRHPGAPAMTGPHAPPHASSSPPRFPGRFREVAEPVDIPGMPSCVTLPDSFHLQLLKCPSEHWLPASWLGICETSAAQIKTCQGWLCLPGLRASGEKQARKGLWGWAAPSLHGRGESGRLGTTMIGSVLALPSAEGHRGRSVVWSENFPGIWLSVWALDPNHYPTTH